VKAPLHRWLLAAALLVAGGALHAAELQVSLTHTWDGEPLLLDSLRYVNRAGETLSVSRLSYLLSEFALERTDGDWVELPASDAWIDLAQHRTAFRLPEVPAGHFSALRFHVGPDPMTNAAPAAKFPAGHPMNASLNGLHWSWQGGYIFMALEGNYRRANGELSGYAYHLARDANRTTITLPMNCTIEGSAAVGLEFDLAALLAPLSPTRDGAATHSRAGDKVAQALVHTLPGALHASPLGLAAPAPSTPRPPPLYLPAHFTPYRFTFNGAFPLPDLPADNPLIEERVALGRRLFSETALSRDRSLSCASCHRAEYGLTDPRRFSTGVEGRTGLRHAMPLFNLAWKSAFFWDGRAPSLREQVLVPIQEHQEMDEPMSDLVTRLGGSPEYPAAFRAAFGNEEVTAEKIGLALEQYLLTLVAGDAKFDRALRGTEQLTGPEQRGFELFMTEYEPRTGQRGADCFHCHGGPLFSDFQFHNNGLVPNPADAGRWNVTGREADRDKFATPSLRNVASRTHYMHDGRFTTLEQVVAHYNSHVQRSPTLDPNLAKHPDEGLQLSLEEQAALVAFLRTLSDLPTSPASLAQTGAVPPRSDR
jgi:cytochrome c peroxidase